MTSQGPRRHFVAFGTRTPGNSESVYYSLQFWLFLGYIWTSPVLVIFSPKTFLGRPTWLVTFCGWMAPFVLPRKASKHPICSFIVKSKLPRNECKGIRIFVPSHMTHFQWPTMSIGVISWRTELGPQESLKACIIAFNFGCFWDFWDFFGPAHIFFRNIPRKSDVTCNVARVLGTICVASKSL